HRNLAWTEARRLGRFGLLLQALFNFRTDVSQRKRDRHATFEFAQGFDCSCHCKNRPKNEIKFVVRGGGLEPPHHCWRQDLHLLRLPISPSSRDFCAETKAKGDLEVKIRSPYVPLSVAIQLQPGILLDFPAICRSF